MKKVVASAVIATLISGMVATSGFAATTDTGFLDISSSYAESAILELQAMGIINGVDAKHFNPKGKLSRAEFAAIVARALDLDATATKSSFSDVEGWAIPYIEAAFKAGIINGMGTDKFEPNAPVTREMAVTILVRALQTQGKLTQGVATVTFTDANTISEWAKQYVALAVAYGLISGNPDGSFDPQGVANREMAAMMGSRLLTAIDKLANPNPTPTPIPTPTPTTTPAPTPTPSSGGSSGGGGGGGTTQPATLSSIAITTPATKLSYNVGEELDITGIVVTGTYSNSKTAAIAITASDVTGFDSSVPVQSQVLTITTGGMTATYTVAIVVTVTNVHIESKSTIAEMSMEAAKVDMSNEAVVGDTVTLSFETTEEVSKLDNFKINGGNPTNFTSTSVSDSVYSNVATYIIADTDPIGDVTFQINVENAEGIYSQTVEATSDDSYVYVVNMFEDVLNEIKEVAARLVEADFSPASWGVLQDALILPERTNADVMAKATAIFGALVRLIDFDDQAGLDKAKSIATSYHEADYTTDSWSVLVDALALPETTNDEVVAKTNAINDAVDDLVRFSFISDTSMSIEQGSLVKFTLETDIDLANEKANITISYHRSINDEGTFYAPILNQTTGRDLVQDKTWAGYLSTADGTVIFSSGTANENYPNKIAKGTELAIRIKNDADYHFFYSIDQYRAVITVTDENGKEYSQYAQNLVVL
ncbi:MAG: S-layer homology domain-containing protein [Candidatus Pristimantibacillus sp.]